MTALTDARNTLVTEAVLRALPVAAGAIIYPGAQVVLNSAGFLEPGSSAVGKTAVGRAEEYASNVGGVDGACTVLVRRGTFAWVNSTGADAITEANVGALCYVVDDQTVAATNGGNTRSIAGVVWRVDADGVWVTV